MNIKIELFTNTATSLNSIEMAIMGFPGGKYIKYLKYIMASRSAFKNNKNQNGRWIKILVTYALSRSAK